ncbi:MAG: hypothetical protein MJ217_00795 [Bacilli bacterium]|nr:hypothetical protein [Bacilli bacterium]
MYKNKLANYETYSKTFNGYDLDSSYTCYEVFIELSRDKEGNIMKNKDGSDRYHAIDDANISTLQEDKEVKVIRENFYKDIYECNGEKVEKVEKDGRRAYYPVDEDRITVLKAGTQVIARNGTYRVPNEVGYVLVNDVDIENPKVVAVRKFKTDDHKAEAEQIVRGNKRKPTEEE